MFTAAEICLVQTQTTLHHLNAQAARRVSRSRLASYAKVQCGQNWKPSRPGTAARRGSRDRRT